MRHSNIPPETGNAEDNTEKLREILSDQVTGKTHRGCAYVFRQALNMFNTANHMIANRARFNQGVGKFNRLIETERFGYRPNFRLRAVKVVFPP
jgi:hypothetical protein